MRDITNAHGDIMLIKRLKALAPLTLAMSVAALTPAASGCLVAGACVEQKTGRLRATKTSDIAARLFPTEDQSERR